MWNKLARRLTPEVDPRPHLDHRVRLGDGRRLAYAAYGEPGGRPVFWFHGTPGGRLQIPPDGPREASRRGFRIIAVDRPGIGGSTPHPERTLLGFADDVGELADQLGYRRFGVCGLSGGGPYVLACAHRMPERVVAGASLGGVGPVVGEPRAPGYTGVLRRLMHLVGDRHVTIGEVVSVAVQPLRPLVHAGVDLWRRFGPQEDRAVFDRPEMRRMFARDIVMATEYGLRGPVTDIALFARPWGFSPRDIRVPIRIWHGDIDSIVPLSHSEHLAAIIPDSRLEVLPGLGHFAGFTNVTRVLDEFAALWPSHDAHDDERRHRDDAAPARP